MRRKFTNINSVIYIILIAVFTLISYMSDQGVIRQEDNLRKSDIRIDNLNSKIYDVDTINNQLISLQTFTTENLVEFNRNNLFWIKALILMEKNSKLSDKEMIENLIDYDFGIEKIKNRFIYHFQQIVNISFEIIDKFESIHMWNEEYFPEYFDKEGYYIAEKLNYDFQLIFNNNINYFHVKDYKKYVPLPSVDNAIKNYSNLNYLDLYKFSHFLLENMKGYYTVMNEEMSKIEKFSSEYNELLYQEIDNNKNISSLKNYLVLTSIISQILSLFFLLLFFRNLLINTI